MLGRLRHRAMSNTAPAEDEWYIPYKTTPDYTSTAGIGYTAPTPKSPTNNIFSYLSPTKSHSSTTKQYPSHLRPTISRSHSHNTITDQPRQASIATSVSVPTGLAAPKMLFSPISRQAHLQSFLPDMMTSDVDLPGPSKPRQRTYSAPNPNYRARKTTNHVPGVKHEERRWAVPTICDLFVYPRPQIIPHTITPPESPETEETSVMDIGNDGDLVRDRRVVEEGRARAKEREEWADLVKRRGRSMSFGNQSGGEDAPIIGNMRARSMERSRSRGSSVTRNGSQKSKMRSGSWSRRGSESRKSGESSRPSFLNMDPESTLMNGRFGKGFGTGTGVGRSTSNAMKKTSLEDSRSGLLREGDYLRGHHHSRSTPEFEMARGLRERSEQPPLPSRMGLIPRPPARTLRIQQPKEIRRPGDVIVIGPPSGKYDSLSRQRSAPLDLSKPLPDLPPDGAEAAYPNGGLAASTSNIGVALTGEAPHTPALDANTTSASTNQSTPTGPAHARAVLAKQHQRARTKRAFQTPTQGPAGYRPRSTHSQPPSATSSVFPMHADIEPAIAMLDISTSSSTATSISAYSGPRRPTALEEAIGRSRAASVGNPNQVAPSKPALRSRPRTAESDDPTLIPLPHVQRPVTPPTGSTPTFCPSPPLLYPIRTDRTPSRPDLQHFDSTASKATVYTDALEDWSDAESSGGVDVTPNPAFGREELGVEDSPQETPVTGRSFDDGDFRVSRFTVRRFSSADKVYFVGSVLPYTARTEWVVFIA
jgi:hypothetical protein